MCALIRREPTHRVERRVMLDRGRDKARARRLGSRLAQNVPLIARLSASVPPDVKITSVGCAPNAPATRSRASSSKERADRPVACRLDAFPSRADASSHASRADARMGVVAA